MKYLICNFLFSLLEQYVAEAIVLKINLSFNKKKFSRYKKKQTGVIHVICIAIERVL